jgi:hypothetical protein
MLRNLFRWRRSHSRCTVEFGAESIREGRAMSAGCWRRFAYCAVIAFLVLGVSAGAQPDNNRLDQIKRLNKVASQKAESDIRDAIKEAVALIKNDPAEALEILDAALHTAEKDPALDDAQRGSLKRLITQHIRDAKAAGGKSDAKTTDTPRRKESSTVTPRKDAEGVQRYEDLRDRLNRLREQAGQRASAKSDKTRGLAGVAKDVDESSIPSDQDMKFPKNWKELLKKRTGTVEMTKAEKKLMKALDTIIEANFDKARFEDVIKYLEEKTGVTILLDKQALDQQQVTYETTVRFRARKVSMRTVLRRILADVGLAYYIKDEAIQVTSVDKAKETLTTRVYYIGDLVSRLNFDLGPILNQQQVADNAKHIIDMIQTQVEPETWSINNGPGRIVFDPARMVLVVKATAEVHYMLGGGGK